MNESVVVISLIGLTVVLLTHVFIMARWSGKVDANLTQILLQPKQWQTDLDGVAASFRLEITSIGVTNRVAIEAINAEIKSLREARHATDGQIALHTGQLREIEKSANRIEDRLTSMGLNGGRS